MHPQFLLYPYSQIKIDYIVEKHKGNIWLLGTNAIVLFPVNGFLAHDTTSTKIANAINLNLKFMSENFLQKYDLLFDNSVTFPNFMPLFNAIRIAF